MTLPRWVRLGIGEVITLGFMERGLEARAQRIFEGQMNAEGVTSGDDLAAAVRTMRDWQKQYFSERSSEALREAKAAERIVDRMVSPSARQDDGPRLF